MIGVIADPAVHDVVREFFELFKTPWEFYVGNRQYDVLICDGEEQPRAGAKLVVSYALGNTGLEDELKEPAGSKGRRSCVLTYRGHRIPIYGGAVTFAGKAGSLLKDEDSQECAAYVEQIGGTSRAWIGYDLFGEVRSLLTSGQPPANAHIPTLELHIAFLRDLITGSGISLVEIPPVPEGFQFVACLTHDVDHPSIRRHKWDHTLFGFLYRAVFGSLRKMIRGEMSGQNLIKNWAAAMKLPFVHMGLAKDFWRDFDDRYLGMEGDLPSTFFVIPFKDCPGMGVHGRAPVFRAAQYRAKDIAGAIQKLVSAGREVGLHGIDAWIDSSRGREELEEIRMLTGVCETGVRMHWLYYGQQSPVVLEKAGAAYDSTGGYNETVGYRAGTTQVFKPLETKRLLELPLHVMDTALFYPTHLALSPKQAKALLDSMVENTGHFGGTLTINWHDRSLAPERLWGGCYSDLIQDLKSRGAWFATAGQAVSWFRKRRSAWFETDSTEPGAVRAKVAVDQRDNPPGLRLRIHKGRELGLSGDHSSRDYVDMAVAESIETIAASEVRR
jgi:peptidoglycan/xylan/chitin deacetylase (PgdA/CDA1 family)